FALTHSLQTAIDERRNIPRSLQRSAMAREAIPRIDRFPGIDGGRPPSQWILRRLRGSRRVFEWTVRRKNADSGQNRKHNCPTDGMGALCHKLSSLQILKIHYASCQMMRQRFGRRRMSNFSQCGKLAV